MRGVLLLLLGALLLAGCDPRGGTKIGDAAPGFSASDISGEQFSLNRMHGKTVVLYFWRTSCCSDSLKPLEPFYRANRNSLEIVAVNEGDTSEVVVPYARNNGLTFRLVTDEHSRLFKKYRVFGFPTIFVIDRQGVIREKILGNIQTAQLEKLIRRHLDIQKEAEESHRETPRR